MATIRRVLYAPDGQPPPDWAEGREFSIIRRLRAKGHTGDQIIRVVEGLRLVIDAGEIDWCPPRSKGTLRMVYHTQNGILSLWNQAEDAYFKQSDRDPELKRRNYRVAAAEARRTRAPTPIGAIPLPIPSPEESP